jgi:Icc-related predicted phosphoesterase
LIRVAAVGDVHFGTDSSGTLRPHLDQLRDSADLLLIAGDLTRHGDLEEAEVIARELEDLPVPVVSVLGNHDYHSGKEQAVAASLTQRGVRVLEGEAVSLDLAGARVGVAGIKGFGGGFIDASGADFGEPEMKAFIRHTKRAAARLETALESLDDSDLVLVLLHYSPIPETLHGEPPQIFPFLGSYLLAEPIDRIGAHLVFHGHAHRGAEKGTTPGGIPVRNVAQSVIQHPYSVYCLSTGVRGAASTEACEEQITT